MLLNVSPDPKKRTDATGTSAPENLRQREFRIRVSLINVGSGLETRVGQKNTMLEETREQLTYLEERLELLRRRL